MAERNSDFALGDVAPMNPGEHPDLLLEALSIAAAYGDPELPKRFPFGVYAHLSGYTGRGWLIGFDDAGYYWESYGLDNPNPTFALSGLETIIEHPETLRQAITHLGFTPDIWWSTRNRHAPNAAQLASTAWAADPATLRKVIVDTVRTRRRPAVALLYSPQVPIIDAVLITGFEAGGEVILGNSPHQGSRELHGAFRLEDWERDVIMVVGLGDQRPPQPGVHPCYTALENALRLSFSATRGTQHLGLAAYDAWERALLDDAAVADADDFTVSRRILYHSNIAGTIACQKAFTAFPDYWDGVPSMGVISGLLQRALAGPQMIHGLMWDVWQVVGGYWRGVKPGDGQYYTTFDNAEETRRFRDRGVRERAAAVIRRARRTDEQSLEALREAKDDWDRCRGRGGTHPCPCLDARCERV